MALTTHAAKLSKTETPYQLDPEQTLKASRALLDHLRKETNRLQTISAKKDLLKTEDQDSDDDTKEGDDIPVWLTLTTKQHIVDKARLNPTKVAVPHSLNASPDLSICIISADPQRSLKNVVADEGFPEDLSSRITKVIGLTKLRARYKSFEQRRALRDEYDIFLADDRIASRLPDALGKVFYKGTSKRPIPIDIALHQREGGKRIKTEKTKKKSEDRVASVATPRIVAKEIARAINTVPVNLKPGTSVAVRVGLGSFSAEQLAENTKIVVGKIIEQHVVKGWRNVKSIHIKSPTSAALPIWLADELWAEEDTVGDVEKEEQNSKDSSLKRKRIVTAKGPHAGGRKKIKSLPEDNSRAQRLAAQKAVAFSDAAKAVMSFYHCIELQAAGWGSHGLGIWNHSGCVSTFHAQSYNSHSHTSAKDSIRRNLIEGSATATVAFQQPLADRHARPAPISTQKLRVIMDRKRKRELRDLNLRTWEGAKDLFPVATSLDSSLKKNTAFIKRLRTGINAGGQAVLLNEIRTLSLEKYLSEIIAAVAEGLGRLKITTEIAAGVEVVSALHQRFGPSNFTKQLAWLLGKGLSPPDKALMKSWTPDVREREERDRLARHRVLLRVVTELWLCGLLRGLDDVERPEEVSAKVKENTSNSSRGHEVKSTSSSTGIRAELGYDIEPFPLEVLKELLGHDPEHTNLTLAVLFVKNFAWDVLGLKLASEDSRKSVEANGAIIEDSQSTGQSYDSEDESPIIEANQRQRYVNVLERYLETVKQHVIRDQKHLSNQSRRNAEAYVKSGEIFEDRQNNFEKQTKAQERLVSNAQILCDALGQEMPNLGPVDGSDAPTAGSVGIVKTGEYLRGSSDGAGIWEDEDERRFYENLVDLKGRVPAILLEDAKKIKGDTADDSPAPSKPAPSEATDASTKKSTESEDQSTAIANRTVGAQVDAILTRLPDLQNKDMVDQVALDFCFLNSKASRNRLVKAIQEVPKGRTDLLSLYARLAATLGQYMPDVLQGLVSHLDDEFRSLQRRKSKDFLGQVRMINIRYLAELTKFGIVPEHVIFHCFKVSLDDFSRMNIEIIANLLENCGRYLLRNSETGPRMTSFLETLGRKKAAQHLGQQERMLIENAMYYVDPPERASIQQKDRTPTELFIRQLVYLDMTKRNYMKILKTIRKLHWEENEVVLMLEKIFSKPAKVKFSNIHLLAVLLGALYRYHQEFAIGVVDNILERITLGLEQNDFKFNQRRIAEVKYLGELYNYKMVDSAVIFDTLYRIVTFGHEGGKPVPGQINALDMPDDYFRIRLACTILDTCGVCFDRGSSKKKLDFFLTFFQYYILTKEAMPMEIDFLVQDTYTLVRPQWKIASQLSEASALFADAIANNYQQRAGAANEATEDAEDSASDDGLGEDETALDAEADQSSDDAEPAHDEDVADDSENVVSSEDEQIIVTREEEKLDPEAEAEFDQAFERMMAESLDSRKLEKNRQFDVPLPIRKVQRAAIEANEDESEMPIKPTSNTMAFSLMTKRGNRPQTRTIELPSDSSFAVTMKYQQEAEREEQQRIKNLVLNYDLHDDNDSHDGVDPLNPSFSRAERSARYAPRARRLNLSDVDWYAQNLIAMAMTLASLCSEFPKEARLI